MRPWRGGGGPYGKMGPGSRTGAGPGEGQTLTSGFRGNPECSRHSPPAPPVSPLHRFVGATQAEVEPGGPPEEAQGCQPRPGARPPLLAAREPPGPGTPALSRRRLFLFVTRASLTTSLPPRRRPLSRSCASSSTVGRPGAENRLPDK